MRRLVIIHTLFARNGCPCVPADIRRRSALIAVGNPSPLPAEAGREHDRPASYAPSTLSTSYTYYSLYFLTAELAPGSSSLACT
ncbi:hypothetical protein BAUCODRAFT_35342 [Baudoinia panamericana UAMH 10762]|uniref:Uncharacterized protein n=1 Tax=Baudoinia panamericana (strain UAMH 10762) TaxID=717646 RepID=M2N960_BAUPA|nr:uncharacterized protein BAUCODRAFT_35342 [Baudoinia panamericana UAMH 10762]EMC95360.1 hypothetical protein BAUCODRAFT_35342 [Baudoinia panamericana UAMH 10762]